MKPWIVLVSRHIEHVSRTTQLSIAVFANDRLSARALVRSDYPPFYVRFWEAGKYIGVCAHFTGMIVSV